MKTLEQFIEAKGLKMDEFEGKSAEEKVELIKELNKENAEAYKTLKETTDANTDAIEKAKAEFYESQSKHVSQVNDILLKANYELQFLVDAKEGDEKAIKTIGDALAANKDELLAMKGSRSHQGFTFKAPADMLISTNVSGWRCATSAKNPRS